MLQEEVWRGKGRLPCFFLLIAVFPLLFLRRDDAAAVAVAAARTVNAAVVSVGVMEASSSIRGDVLQTAESSKTFINHRFLDLLVLWDGDSLLVQLSVVDIFS